MKTKSQSELLRKKLGVLEITDKISVNKFDIKKFKKSAEKLQDQFSHENIQFCVG